MKKKSFMSRERKEKGFSLEKNTMLSPHNQLNSDWGKSLVKGLGHSSPLPLPSSSSFFFFAFFSYLNYSSAVVVVVASLCPCLSPVFNLPFLFYLAAPFSFFYFLFTFFLFHLFHSSDIVLFFNLPS